MYRYCVRGEDGLEPSMTISIDDASWELETNPPPCHMHWLSMYVNSKKQLSFFVNSKKQLSFLRTLLPLSHSPVLRGEDGFEPSKTMSIVIVAAWELDTNPPTSLINPRLSPLSSVSQSHNWILQYCNIAIRTRVRTRTCTCTPCTHTCITPWY